MAAGLVSGVLVAFGKLPAFIATLAMLSIARGLALVLSGGVPVAQPTSVAWFGSTLWGWLPVPVVVMVVLGLLAAFILNRRFGRAIYAIGGNEEAARLSGINVHRQKLIIYALAGTFSAVAGLVLAGRWRPAAAGRSGLRARRHRRGGHRRHQSVRRHRPHSPERSSAP